MPLAYIAKNYSNNRTAMRKPLAGKFPLLVGKSNIGGKYSEEREKWGTLTHMGMHVRAVTNKLSTSQWE